MSDLHCTLSALHLHPVKSCGGFEARESLLVETGLDLDRAWMVVDTHGEMLTQRELPRMALVLQFCSWSACRMNNTSRARSSTGCGRYFSSVILNSMFRKLPVKLRSLSG